MEEEDECPELVPIKENHIEPTAQIPVTIITGYLGQIFNPSSLLHHLIYRNYINCHNIFISEVAQQHFSFLHRCWKDNAFKLHINRAA